MMAYEVFIAGRKMILALLGCVMTACAPQLKLPGKEIVVPYLKERSVIMADGVALPLRVWPAKAKPRAVMLALHGFNDYGNFIREPAAYFSERGVQVYSYDQRGFGETPNLGYWPGKKAFTRDLFATAKLLRERHKNTPFYLLGASMGAAVIMTTMVGEHKPQVSGVIIVAPAVWGRKTQPLYQNWFLAIAARVTPWLRLSGGALDVKPSDNIPMLRALSRDPLVIKETRVDTIWGLVNLMDAALASSNRFQSKALILYGDKDEIIRQKPMDLMISQLPNESIGTWTLKRYGDGYHMLLRGLNAEAVWKDILNWIGSEALSN